MDNAIALGKILRIDVNGTNSANGKYGIPAGNLSPQATGAEVKEIYASGFRNPYRFSFDGANFIVPDVGQNEIEEVNIVEGRRELTAGGTRKELLPGFNTRMAP